MGLEEQAAEAPRRQIGAARSTARPPRGDRIQRRNSVRPLCTTYPALPNVTVDRRERIAALWTTCAWRRCLCLFDRFPCSRRPTCCGRLRRLHLFHHSPGGLAHMSVRPPTTAGHHRPRQQVGAADALLAPAIAHAGPVGLTLTGRGAGILRDHQSSESPSPKVHYRTRHKLPINYCRRIATRLSSDGASAACSSRPIETAAAP
jgi:hypothetical protein